ncbi:MAG: hypothetical protein HEQ32_09135 [Vampirovibrio sp.]
MMSTMMGAAPALAPANAYVPLAKRDKKVIESPATPEEELQLVQDLYEQSSVSDFGEKVKAPYSKTVDVHGQVMLEANPTYKGPQYHINELGQVSVQPPAYDLPGAVKLHEEATPAEVLQSVQDLMANAKPANTLKARETGVTYAHDEDGDLRLVSYDADDNTTSYRVKTDGSVVAYSTNHNGGYYPSYSGDQQIVKPGELPVLENGQKRPVGQNLNLEV